MKIHAKIKASANEEKIEQIGSSKFLISVKAGPIEGRANIAVIKIIAKHFQVTQSDVKILKGKTFKEKIVEINN